MVKTERIGRVSQWGAYVVITPVLNEEHYIGHTIQSVADQTLLPQEWVIIDDGSTDSTGQILQLSREKYSWIKVISRSRADFHSYRSVVEAIELGFSQISSNNYRYVSLLDGDIVLPSSYFEILLRRMELDPTVGLAGGVVLEPGERLTKGPRNTMDVPGAVQTFRKECFFKVRPLIPIPEGGWDAITCAKARMLGYKTILFTDLTAQHLKPRNAFNKNPLKRLWLMGVRDCALGYSFVFEAAKCLARITDRPKVIGSLIWFWGYLCSFVTRKQCLVPLDVRKYMRKEQKERLIRLFGLD